MSYQRQRIAVLATFLLLAINSVSFGQQSSELDKGRALMNDGKCPEAIDAFKKHILTNNNEWRAHENIGLCYGRLNKYQEAIPFFEKVIELNAKEFDAYSMLAISYNKTKNFKAAISILDKLIAISPDQANAYYYSGVNFYEDKQYEKAIAAYRKAVQLDPSNGDYKGDLKQAISSFAFNQGVERYDGKEYLAAAKAFEQSAALYPAVETFTNIGLSYGNLHEYPKAVTAFQAAVKIDPNYPAARENLAAAEAAKQAEKEKRIAIWSGIIGAVAEAVITTSRDESSPAKDINQPQGNPNQDAEAVITASVPANSPGGFAADHRLDGRYKLRNAFQYYTFYADGTVKSSAAAAGNYRGGEYAVGSEKNGT